MESLLCSSVRLNKGFRLYYLRWRECSSGDIANQTRFLFSRLYNLRRNQQCVNAFFYCSLVYIIKIKSIMLKSPSIELGAMRVAIVCHWSRENFHWRYFWIRFMPLGRSSIRLEDLQVAILVYALPSHSIICLFLPYALQVPHPCSHTSYSTPCILTSPRHHLVSNQADERKQIRIISKNL